MYEKRGDLTSDQYQGSTTRSWNKRGGASKETAIKKAIERKESSIKSFTDAKSMQIAVSSAFNGAAEIVSILLGLGKVDPSEYWEVHDLWYDKYLALYMRKQNEAREEASNASASRNDYLKEAKDYAGVDAANESQEELL